MNGTLISQPPGGGGSGSSVKNGGPACTKLIANDKAMAHMTQRSFAGLCVALDGTEYSNRSLTNKNQPTTSGRLFDLLAANLRWLAATMRNSDKQGVSFRHEKSCARTVRLPSCNQFFLFAITDGHLSRTLGTFTKIRGPCFSSSKAFGCAASFIDPTRLSQRGVGGLLRNGDLRAINFYGLADRRGARLPSRNGYLK